MIDFPTSPVTGQAYTYGSRTWVWDATGWQIQINAGQLAAVFICPGTEVQTAAESLPILVSSDWQLVNYV